MRYLPKKKETVASEEKTPQIINFAQLNRLILKDLNKEKSSSSILSKFTKQQVANFMKDPYSHQKSLRDVSNYLYNASPHYKRLIGYFANMLTLDYVVEPYGLNFEKVKIEEFKKQYQKTLDTLETMNIKHEFLKILKIAFREDVFYGYEHSTKESYFIQKLNPDFCQISSIEDGVYNFAFDFTFFDKTDNKNKLNTYPKEFKAKYERYKSSKQNWIELDSSNTICIKINEEIEYPVPPFNVIFESVFDIEDYKVLKKTKTKIDNYAVLTQKIPIDDKKGEPNKFLIELDTAVAFHNKASQALPDEVGLITSPMDIDVIKFDKDKVGNDNVADSERDLYNAAGVSQILFNSDKATGNGISKSIITDEEIALGVLRQFERWVNRKLKNVGGNYKFKTNFLNTTVFNINEVFEKYLKAAQFGMPVKHMVGASLGLSPSSMTCMAFLENDVLGLHDKLIPLTSAHTQSSKDGAGAPKKSEDALSDSGEKTRDNDANIRE